MRSWIQNDRGKAAGPDTEDGAIKKKISEIASEIANRRFLKKPCRNKFIGLGQQVKI